MNDYVPKPFRTSQLISAIAKAAGREIRVTEKIIPGKQNEISTAQRVTDLGYLEKFCEGDKMRMKKYIDMFLASAPYLTDALTTAMNNNDNQEIASQMHGYKTNLTMMGMKETKDLASEIEMQSRNLTNPDPLKMKLQKMLQQIEMAASELKNY